MSISFARFPGGADSFPLRRFYVCYPVFTKCRCCSCLTTVGEVFFEAYWQFTFLGKYSVGLWKEAPVPSPKGRLWRAPGGCRLGLWLPSVLRSLLPSVSCVRPSASCPQVGTPHLLPCRRTPITLFWKWASGGTWRREQNLAVWGIWGQWVGQGRGSGTEGALLLGEREVAGKKMSPEGCLTVILGGWFPAGMCTSVAPGLAHHSLNRWSSSKQSLFVVNQLETDGSGCCGFKPWQFHKHKNQLILYVV